MRNVVIIDDDPVIRSMYAQVLSDSGWKVAEAEDGEAGVAVASRIKPEAVVCDLLMPRMNGFQVCRALRERPDLRHTRIVVTSGRDYPSDRQMALDSGADAYLVKPIDLAEFTGLLDGFGRASGREASPATGPAAPDGSAEPTRIQFWGVRGSIPAPGRRTVETGGNTSCVCVRADGEIIVLDAGTGIRGLGQALQAEFKDQPIALTLLVSHTHWDHIQGFPFFMPAYAPRNRIRIVGYEGARAGLQGTLASQMESPYFPVGLKQLPGNLEFIEQKDLAFSIGRVPVRAWFLNHPGICMGYRIETRCGSVVYAPDNEPFQRQRRGRAPAHRSADSTEFVSRQDAQLVEFFQDADVLIIDAQYDAAEYESRRGWGHGCIDDVVALGLDAGVRKLFLFHHDPDHDDEHVARRLEHARKLVKDWGGEMEVEAAREEMEVVLQPKAAE
jgi:phosphoribosyl 1,2-cyclic phosphodiesterase/ActR/RegA family two-component response regulator